MPTGGFGKFIAGAFVRSGGEVRLEAYSGRGGHGDALYREPQPARRGGREWRGLGALRGGGRLRSLLALGQFALGLHQQVRLVLQHHRGRRQNDHRRGETQHVRGRRSHLGENRTERIGGEAIEHDPRRGGGRAGEIEAVLRH
jgi:hypothetical protein